MELRKKIQAFSYKPTVLSKTSTFWWNMGLFVAPLAVLSGVLFKENHVFSDIANTTFLISWLTPISNWNKSVLVSYI